MRDDFNSLNYYYTFVTNKIRLWFLKNYLQLSYTIKRVNSESTVDCFVLNQKFQIIITCMYLHADLNK